MRVSIVIPNHNRADALPFTLEALCKQTYPSEKFEVVVVDQVSTDGSRELARMYQAPYRLRLVEQDAKYGVSVGRNGGVTAASGELVILLDSDIIADPNLVQAHAELHRKASGPILGCGRLLPYPPAYTTFIEQVSNPDAGLDRGTECEDFPFWHAFGGHLSFSIQIYNRIGPFKPELRGAEDIEFAYRAAQSGAGIKNCSQAIGYHNHGRSLVEHKQRAFEYWSIVPTFLAMHPELRGKIPGIAELEPVQWGRDSIPLIRAKALAEFWSCKMVRSGLFKYLNWAEKQRAIPRLTKFCYYRLMLGEMRAGARQGRLGQRIA
ncbi:MAG: glycosyl transferase family 2 [Chloroflexi bacterium]|nr:glycosyl transferase family 2 [Chloroflexota bacterium]